jgi:hypothetical protein
MSPDIGPVPRPTDRLLLDKLSELEYYFPSARQHRVAMRRIGSEYIFADRCTVSGVGNSWTALVRFSRAIETTFGFTREALIFYSPYRDLQVRTFEALPQVLDSLPRQVDQDTLFLHSLDPRLEMKLYDWSTPWFTVIPLPDLTSEIDKAAEVVVESIRSRIFARDLYYEVSPVSGERFFGRRRLLQALLQDIRVQRASGIFALRRSGKTSVLRQLDRLLRNVDDPNYVFILRDLESLPSPPDDPIPGLLSDLSQDVIQALSANYVSTAYASQLLRAEDIATFRRALQSILREVQADNVKLVLALDEIEYLVPPNQIDLEKADIQSIPQFLGAIRSLIQENRNFTFLMSGLTSWIVESGRLYSRPNPLFSWMKMYFLASFTVEDASELATVIGQKMGIEWTNHALAQVYVESGGNPYLYRNLLSTVVKTLPVNVEKRVVTEQQVLTVINSWRRSVAGNFKEMIDHVKLYYPGEAYLLELLLNRDPEFDALVKDDPQGISHLIQLGLIEELPDEKFRPSSVLRFAGRSRGQ